MSRNKPKGDTRYRKAGVGLAVVVGGVIGIGVMRSRKRGPGKVVEDSTYRGVRYVIVDCQGFRASIPKQTVGDVSFEGDKALAIDLELARKWVQQTVDKRLGSELLSTFLGARDR